MVSSRKTWVSGLTVMLVLAGCASHDVVRGPSRRPGAVENSEPQYPAIFAKVRSVFTTDPITERKLARKIPESEIVELLAKDPVRLQDTREQIVAEIEAMAKAQAFDPQKHVRLIPPAGMPGYSNLRFYVNHPFYIGKKLVKASNLVKVWRDFLAQGSRKIMLNVFDFDLYDGWTNEKGGQEPGIVETLVARACAGAFVRVGIDKNVVAARPEVKKVADFLAAPHDCPAGSPAPSAYVNVTQVESVALNHQKMAVVDWDDPSRAKVLFSSGNLTQSCLGPEGDLKDVPAALRPSSSIPNANHVMTMDSYVLATVVSHELTKTLNPDFLFRGAAYPITGSYQVTGPGVDPLTLEPYPEHSLVITFSPGGGYRNINRNLIAKFIRETTGPIRMLQFAYSSAEVNQALLERAIASQQKPAPGEPKRSFDFQSVGDTPFAVQGWSQFLNMSGLERYVLPNGKNGFRENPENAWIKALRPSFLRRLRERIRVAPASYKQGSARIAGKSYPVSAKLHHKVLVTGPFAIVGTSFNFSDGAESNNEQLLVFREPDLVRAATGMTKWMAEHSPLSVYEEAQRRNKYGGGEEVDNDLGEAVEAGGAAAFSVPTGP